MLNQPTFSCLTFSRQDPVVGSCKYGHEISGFINSKETGFETRTK
jgi:hypothetical protein